MCCRCGYFFFQAEDGIRDYKVTGVQTCALPIWLDCTSCVAAPLASRDCSEVNPTPCTATSAYAASASRLCRAINTAFLCGSPVVVGNVISAVTHPSPDTFIQTK